MQPVRKIEVEETTKPSESPMTERQKKVATIKAQVQAKSYKININKVARALIKAFDL